MSHLNRYTIWSCGIPDKDPCSHFYSHIDFTLQRERDNLRATFVTNTSNCGTTQQVPSFQHGMIRSAAPTHSQLPTLLTLTCGPSYKRPTGGRRFGPGTDPGSIYGLGTLRAQCQWCGRACKEASPHVCDTECTISANVCSAERLRHECNNTSNDFDNFITYKSYPKPCTSSVCRKWPVSVCCN